MQAKKLVQLGVDEIWELNNTRHLSIRFDDTTLETTGRATILSWPCWEIHRQYPKTPVLSRHHIGDEILGDKTLTDLCARIKWDCYEAYDGQVSLEELDALIYRITNTIYNDFTYRLEAYIGSISILDFIDVIDHPDIKKANDSVESTQLSIDNTYSVIEEVLLDKKQLRGNAIAKAARSGLISMGQIKQCVGPRGFLTDIDSEIFKDPILVGYAQGMRNLYDVMIESRSASKALMFSKDPLAASQYFNRKMQFLTATIPNVNFGDCGTDRFVQFRVRKSDLPALAGKYYKGRHGLAVVDQDDHHLIGKNIELRSVLYCNDPDPYGVCSTCFGTLALQIPAGTNVGHVSSTVLCKHMSQNILSTKHLDGSSTVDGIVLTDHDKKYIRVGTDPNTIKLAKGLKNRSVTMLINASEAEGIADIHHIDDIRKLESSRVAKMTEVTLGVKVGSGYEHATVPVSLGNRLGSFTTAALEYIRTHGYELTSIGNYVIDLKDWEVEQPLFELPRKHISMVDFMKTVENFVRGAAKRKRTPRKRSSRNAMKRSVMDHDTPDSALLEFYELVRSKLPVNLSYLEMIIYSTMIRSEEPPDYRLPRPGEPLVFGSYQKILPLRSLSAAMAYEDHADVLLSPTSFTYVERPSHPLDPLIMG